MSVWKTFRERLTRSQNLLFTTCWYCYPMQPSKQTCLQVNVLIYVLYTFWVTLSIVRPWSCKMGSQWPWKRAKVNNKTFFYGTGQWVVNFKSISIYPDWLYIKYAQMQRKQRNTGNSWNDLHRSINTGLSANCVNGLTLQDNH